MANGVLLVTWRVLFEKMVAMLETRPEGQSVLLMIQV
jgi:hypothetical protein